jgi:serine/threonine protein phosphatase PrpC
VTTTSDVRTLEIPCGDLRLAVAGGTQVGVRYSANFDVLHLDPDLPLVVVADGMGDGRGSAYAGRTAVDVLVAEVRTSGGEPVGPRRLRAAVGKAQRRVRLAGEELGELAGCTLTALVAGAPDDPAGGWIVQIGDSRVYRQRGGVLELLTVDHTVAWLGAVYGWYPADSPAAAKARYQLLRYIGHPGMPDPDVLSVALRPGDVYCLCTDGLAEQVPYQRLAEVLGAAGTAPAEMVPPLLADALAAGGHDNATVAVVKVEQAVS